MSNDHQLESVLEDRALDLAIWQMRTAELGDSSYIVVSAAAAAIVDPQRDTARYEAALDRLGVQLVAVLETHMHNDYLSGGPDLARTRSVTYVVPEGSGYEGPHRAASKRDEIAVGRIRLRPLFTPGHTPHHLSYAIVAGSSVMGVLSGGSLLVGAVGRTDLISPEQTETLACQQYRSAQKIGRLPDPVVIGPTHGGGSFCTSAPASDETWTTVGREKRRNPALLAADEASFVRQQVEGLSPYPAYYAAMGPINRSGSRPWPGRRLEPLSAARVHELMAAASVVVDTRPRQEFAARHIPGSTNIELGGPFSAYLGWIFPPRSQFVLLSTSAEEAEEAARQAARIGIDTIAGWLSGGVAAWAEAGLALISYRSIDMQQLQRELKLGDDRKLLDVRQDAEWSSGHLPGAVHLPIQLVPARAAELAAGGGSVYVHCASGYRAAIAASQLQAAGADVVHTNGGLEDWTGFGHPIEVPIR